MSLHTGPSVLKLAGAPGTGTEPGANQLSAAQFRLSTLIKDKDFTGAEKLLGDNFDSIPAAARPAAMKLLETLKIREPAGRPSTVFTGEGGSPESLALVPGGGRARFEELRAGGVGLPRALQVTDREVRQSRNVPHIDITTFIKLRAMGFEREDIKDMRAIINEDLPSRAVFDTKLQETLIELGDTPKGLQRDLVSGDPVLQDLARTKLEKARSLMENRVERDEGMSLLASSKEPLGLMKGVVTGATNYYDKELALSTGRLKALPRDTAQGVALKSGLFLNSKDKDFVQSINSALSTLGEMKAVATRLFTTTDPRVAAFRAGQITLQDLARTNADAALWMSQGAFMFQFARAFGNDARISDKDAELAAETSFLGVVQTRDVVAAGLERLQRIFENGRLRLFGEPELKVPQFRFGDPLDPDRKQRFLKALGKIPDEGLRGDI